ncbi:hypothetical protein VB776_07030 [Arcicella sp. DC2W]|uniref:Uncharacterized protein n=1 Tax=Arcicella gelida TaxID=2984195 RepID=A0ABU5S2J5_9BACT|nr:hypothetical protein [Arcicella sp. DC2W]MEA5402660.1 hypothetical protein [Arcicella sp. DC2W]
MNPVIIATTTLPIHGFLKGQTIKVLPIDGRFIPVEDANSKNQRVFPKNSLQFVN